MKKGLSLLCLLAMLLSLVTAMTVGTAAVAPSTLPDTIAKYRTAVYTETKPTIDGKKDAAYEKATPFYVDTPNKATVWMLWNEKGLYFYAEMRSLNEDGTGNVTNIGFWISGVQYAYEYDAKENSSWWKNTDNSQYKGNYRFQIGWTDTEAVKAVYGLSNSYAPEGLEKKTIKHVKEDGTEQGFDLEVFVPMKANDWEISKGAGQSYIGLGMVTQRNMLNCSGFEGTKDMASLKTPLLPSDLEPVRLISDPKTTCQHEKTTYTITAPTLNASGTEKGTCPSCGTVVTRKLPLTKIQMLGAQTTTVENNQYSVRFVSQIATLENYSEVGYEITLYYGKTQDDMGGGYTLTWKTQTVFTSIQAGTDTETPREKEGGKYLVAVPVTDIPVNDDTTYVKFVVKPFVTLMSGETVYATGNGTAVVVNAGTVESVQLLGTGTVDPQSGKTLNLVWSDEFNSSTLDNSKWNLTKETWNNVNYTTNKKNFRLENGEAVMNLYREKDGTYSSNLTLTTKDRMSFKYGYLEIYAKVPFSQGSFPAFWFRSAVQHRSTDYVMAEVDVFEVYQKGCAESTLHKWFLRDPVKGNAYRHFSLESPMSKEFPKDKWETLSDEYHLWGFGWTKDTMYMTVDGEVFATYDITDQSDFRERDDVSGGEGFGEEEHTGMSCFQDPLYILFSNNPGINFRDSNWAPNENTVFPKTFSVKWVRLYQDSTGELYNDLA